MSRRSEETGLLQQLGNGQIDNRQQCRVFAGITLNITSGTGASMRRTSFFYSQAGLIPKNSLRGGTSGAVPNLPKILYSMVLNPHKIHTL